MTGARGSGEHWADEVATRVAAAGRPPVISTGISPSGEIHIGNMREVLTADAVYRALGERGQTVRFNYVADTFDPLRKVYPFLPEERYASRVGCPLSEIPCPCDGHPSYAEHFLEPFLEALAELRVEVEVERADRMYKSGRMNPYIVRALERRDRIVEILAELTGKRVADSWSPFNPLCRDCGRMTASRVIGFSATDETIEYECGCGARETAPMAGGGKLVWRIDWPARWQLLGVTVEPFGKDHATRGGSYDTGLRVAREVFDGEAPFPIPYEWIRLKGKGDMASSKGNVLSIGRMLEVVPPEVLRYLVIRERPQRTINFDPGLPLLQLVDEFDDRTSKTRNQRAVELSRAGGFVPVGVPFKHLVVVVQATNFDEPRALEVLHRTGYPNVTPEGLSARLSQTRRWLETFAPEELRFEVQPALPPQAGDLSAEQRSFLGRLSERLTGDMNGQAVHDLIYAVSGEFENTRPADLFRAIYVALLGKARGPRAGGFIAVLGVGFCAARFAEAAQPAS